MRPPMSNHGYQSKAGVYGGASGFAPEARYIRRQRQRMNLVSVCQCLFVPWILFCIVFALTSFRLHYNAPWMCWLLVGILGAIVVVFGAAAFGKIKAKMMMQDESREPSWFIFLFLMMAISVALGAILGNMIFSKFMSRYYDYVNLNDYNDVNVAKMRGTQLMDGARLTFEEGATLDTRKALGFKNQNTYCVAPITIADKAGIKSELTNYDFWAVGLNCCSGDTSDFHCGEFDNPKARSGLRLLEDDERGFYRLAVQQAEAMYHIRAAHPLFFYWTEDPVKEMESWKEEGQKFFVIGMIVHFAWQLLVVGLAAVGFSKMAYY